MVLTPQSEHITLAAVLAEHAERRGSVIAFDCGTRAVSYAALQRNSQRVADALAAVSVKRRDRVAYYGKSCVEYFEFLFAAMHLGAVVVPINWRLAPAEVGTILRDANVTVMLADGEFAERAVAAARQIGPTLRVVALQESAAGDALSWHHWKSAALPRRVPPVHLDGDDIALQIYTSGTTGTPKGVMMSHRALLAYLETLSAVAGMDDTTTALSTMPLFHIGGTGWALAAAYRGATTIQMRDVDPDLMLRAIERHRVTTLIAVPVVMRMLLQSPLAATADLSSLRTFYYGGGPMMQATLDAALKIFSCDFVQGFGMTECPLITALAPVDHLGAPGRLRSCGRPVRGTDVRLVDPGTGRDVPDGSVGEIVVRSPQLLAGYWNKPEAQRDSFLDGQWFRTGDAAFRDSEGYLYMQDRIKDMIVSGGENVYPAEVENVLALHPDVAECAVVGVPSDRWTETVKAVVVAASPTLTPQELIGFCKERLAGYKCPTTVDFVAALPRTPSGKVEKFRLRAACAR